MKSDLEGRLLVVEDDPAQRSQLAGFLRDLGADVGEAENGIEALAILDEALYDVVISDLRMPGMDGEELLRRIGEINPEIGLILVTA